MEERIHFAGNKSEEVSAPRKDRVDLGDGMELIRENFYGWWKPRYLVDKRARTAVEFMDAEEHFCTVTVEDIDWDSLAFVDEECKQTARNLDIHYPTSVKRFKRGVAQVSWQLSPDGYYYMDEDGYGMTPDVEIEIYGFIDRKGKVVSKFRHVAGNLKLINEMRAEAEKIANARI